MLQLRPTFSESWYRVVNLRVRLRSTAQIFRQYYRGERWYVVRDPAGNQFHRLSDAAYRFVGLLDGSRTIGEAWELVGGQLDDDAPTQPEVIQILSQLHSANLIEADIPADAGVLLKRHKLQMKRKFQGRLMNILFPRIPLWDPDSFVCRWLSLTRLAFNKFAAILWLVVVVGAIVALVPHWDELREAAVRSINPNNWMYLWAVFVLIKFLHELGHAFSCRHFGGEIHEMGIMFLVFIPTPYVDASTAWSFPSRWQRVFVGGAGMVVELFVAALCAFVWLVTHPGVPVWGIPVNELAYNAMLIASVSTVLFNANPLLRYDGYYMLSDFLEIPNLQQKSKEYLHGLVKRHVFRVKSLHPLPPIPQRLWLFFYGLISTIYRVFIGIMIILLVAYTVPILGVLMAIGGVITWLVVPLGKLIKYLTIEPELHRKRGRATAFVLSVVAAIVIAFGMVPWWVRVHAAGILEPVQHTRMHTRAAGRVAEVHASNGDWVKEGQVLVVFSDEGLDARIEELEARLDGLYAQAQLFSLEDPAREKIVQLAIANAHHHLDKLRKQQADLIIRAPFDGQLIAPEISSLPGQFFHHGQELFTVATNDRLLVRVALEQRDGALVSRLMNDDGTLRLEYEPEIRLAGARSVVVKGHQAKLIPGALGGVPHPALTHLGGGNIPNDPNDPRGQTPAVRSFELRIDLPNPENQYVYGQRAYIRLTVDKEPLAFQWYRRFLQLIEVRSQTGSKLV